MRLLTVIRQEVTASVEVDLLAAEAQMAAGQVEEAMSLVTDMARKHPTSSKVLHLRAKGLFMQGNFPRALTHLQEALALDPDNEDVKNLFRTIKRVERKKKEGNDAFKAGRVQEAIDSYTECLEHVGTGNGPFRATVLCNRAAARMKCVRVRCFGVRVCRMRVVFNRFWVSLSLPGGCLDTCCCCRGVDFFLLSQAIGVDESSG